MNTQLSQTWTGRAVLLTAATMATTPFVHATQVIQPQIAYETGTTQIKGFVAEQDEFFITEAQAKDLLVRLDSSSPVTRLPDNMTEEEFLAFIQS